jgi:hypothetical protein
LSFNNGGELPPDFLDNVLLLIKYTNDEQLMLDEQQEAHEKDWHCTKRGTWYRKDTEYDNVYHIYP